MAKIKMGIVDYAKELVDEELYIKSLSGEQQVKAEKFFKALNDMFARNAESINFTDISSMTIEDAFKEAFASNESSEKTAKKIIESFYLDGFDSVELNTSDMVQILKDFLDFVPQSSIVPGGVVRTPSNEQTEKGDNNTDAQDTNDNPTNGIIGEGSHDDELDALVEKAIRIIKDDSFINTLDGDERNVANDLFPSLKREVEESDKGTIFAGLFPLPGRHYSEVERRELDFLQRGYDIRGVLRQCFLRDREKAIEPNTAFKMAYSVGAPESYDTRLKVIDDFFNFVLERSKEKTSENPDNDEDKEKITDPNPDPTPDQKEEEKKDPEIDPKKKDDPDPAPKKKKAPKPRKKKDPKPTPKKKKVRDLHVDKAMKMGLLLAEPKRGFWEKLFHRPARLAVIGGVVTAAAIGAGIMLGPGAYYGLSALSKFGLMFSGVVPGAIIGGATYGIGRAVLSKVSKNVKKAVLKDKFDRGLKKCSSLEKVSTAMTSMSEHFREKATTSYKDRKGLLKIRALHKAARSIDRAILGKVFRPLERIHKKAHNKKVMETISLKSDINELESATGKSMTFAGLKKKVEKKTRKSKKAEDQYAKKQKAAKAKIAEIEKKFKEGRISEEDKDIEISQIKDDLDYEGSVLEDKKDSAMEAIEHYNEKYRDKSFNNVGEMSGEDYQDFLEENNVRMSEYTEQKTYDLEASELYAHLSDKKRKELARLASLDEKGQEKYLDKAKNKTQAEMDLKVARTMAGIMDRVESKQKKTKKKGAIVQVEIDNSMSDFEK